MLRGLGDALSPGGRLAHTVAVRFQAGLKQSPKLDFVINHQRQWLERCGLAHADASGGVEGAFGIGRCKMNAAPPLDRFSARIVPPCASTNPLTMVRPRPEPPVGADGPR